MTRVQIYIDSSARGGSDGPDDYETALHSTDGSDQLHEKAMSDGYAHAINNRMELMAAIVGPEVLNRSYQAELYLDSKYPTDASNQYQTDSWVAKGWSRGKSRPIKNVDLWRCLLEAKEPRQVKFIWVRGHVGHPENEGCDVLATSATDGENLMTNQGLEV